MAVARTTPCEMRREDMAEGGEARGMDDTYLCVCVFRVVWKWFLGDSFSIFFVYLMKVEINK